MADSTVMICFQFCPKTLCISGRTLAGFWGWQWLIISNTHSKPIVYVFDHLLKLGKLSKIALRFSFWKIVPTWKNILVCLLVDGAFCLSQKLGLWQILNWSKSRRSLHSIQCMLEKFLVSVSKDSMLLLPLRPCIKWTQKFLVNEKPCRDPEKLSPNNSSFSF